MGKRKVHKNKFRTIIVGIAGFIRLTINFLRVVDANARDNEKRNLGQLKFSIPHKAVEDFIEKAPGCECRNKDNI